jgi:hypothetical protein
MDKKIILIVIIVLAAILAISIFINNSNNQESIMKYMDEKVVFKENGEIISTLTMEDIIDFGKVDFEVIKDTSNTDPTPYTYSGILLNDLLKEIDIELTKYEVVVCSAVDGFASAISMDKVMEDDNVYLAYEVDGKPLGTKEDRGEGPFMIIISKDQFAQNWCKYLIEVDLQ